MPPNDCGRIPLLLAILLAATAATGQKPPGIDAPEWQRARAVWFGQASTPTVVAEVCVGWERLPAGHAAVAAIGAAADGAMLPFGGSLWPVLETFTEIRLGGVDVPRGSHPFALQRTADGHALALFDGDVLRQARVAVSRPPAKGIATIPLPAATEGTASPLHCELTTGDDGAFTWRLRAGTATWQLAGTAAAAKGAFPLAQAMERGCCRAVFAVAGGSGAAVVDHGVPQWTEGTGKAMAALAPGRRWRLGNDWWTTLHTDLPLTLAGKKLPPGHWHLVLERSKNGWNLLCCAAAEQLRDARDAFAPDGVKPVLSIPVTIDKKGEPVSPLRVQFVHAGGKTTLAVAFGEQRLSVRVQPG